MSGVLDRLRARVTVADSGCWEFTGALTAAGYGVIGLGGRGAGIGYAHRLMYEAEIGGIPDGLHIDHLCRNRKCCNPAHLEAVTQAENNRRSKRDNPRTHCKYGHEFTPENTYYGRRQRICKTCSRARYLASV